MPAAARPPHRAPLSSTKKTAFMVVWLLLLLTILEGGARLWPRSERFVGELTDTEVLGLAREHPFFVEDGGMIRTNPLLQCRLHAQRFDRTPGPRELRGLVLGESSVFGVVAHGSIPPSAAIPGQLAHLIRERNPGIASTMINGGLPGVTSLQMVRQATFSLALKPQLVVIYIGHNDNNEVLRRAARAPGSLGFLRSHSHFYGGLLTLIRSLRQPSMASVNLGGAEHLAAVREFEENYTQIIRTYRAKKIPVFACDVVGRFSAEGEPKTLEAYRRAIAEVARRERVPYLPLGEHLRRRARAERRTWVSLFSDPVHFTPEGYRWVAAAIYAGIAPNLGWQTPPVTGPER